LLISVENGLGVAEHCRWLNIADTVMANVSTDFAALTGSTDEAKIIGDALAQRRLGENGTLRIEASRHSWSRLQGGMRKSSVSPKSSWAWIPSN
jgi:hypothetical protein